eukprot:768793-Rhodomonas_salina.2
MGSGSETRRCQYCVHGASTNRQHGPRDQTHRTASLVHIGRIKPGFAFDVAACRTRTLHSTGVGRYHNAPRNQRQSTVL